MVLLFRDRARPLPAWAEAALIALLALALRAPLTVAALP